MREEIGEILGCGGIFDDCVGVITSRDYIKKTFVAVSEKRVVYVAHNYRVNKLRKMRNAKCGAKVQQFFELAKGFGKKILAL